METSSIKIQTSKGESEVTLHVFPAMTGFELNRRYRVDYKLQQDAAARSAFTADVLAFAEVNGARLNTEAAINAALETWRNVEKIFHAVLELNEVELELAEEKARWFEFAGHELAASFVAEASALMSPLMQLLEERKGE